MLRTLASVFGVRLVSSCAQANSFRIETSELQLKRFQGSLLCATAIPHGFLWFLMNLTISSGSQDR
jgi:hypothetical protein